jgi:tRNA(Ile)-lysidine synthase
LTPAIADIRRAVREALAGLGAGALRVRMRPPAANAPERRGAIAASGGKHDGGFVLVALSGGPDSLALASATAFEAPRAGLRAGAVVVDHGLQAGSADAAAAAAEQARALGLDPVLVRRVDVGTGGGPEAAARTARYAALAEAAAEAGASAVLLGHTLDDQAETVLLGLARGSGAASLSGMAPGPDVFLRPPATDAPARPGANVATGRNRSGEGASVVYLRPLLGIRRATTLQFCEDAGLTPWHDPQNGDPAFARVRVRDRVLPLLEAELGPGIAEALARTAELVREDASALDHFAEEQAEELADHAEAGLSLSVSGLAHNPAALRQRIIRLAVAAEFGVSLSRAQTLEVARLVTDWHGQGPLDLPGVRVVRQGARVVFSARGREISSEGTAPA